MAPLLTIKKIQAQSPFGKRGFEFYYYIISASKNGFESCCHESTYIQKNTGGKKTHGIKGKEKANLLIIKTLNLDLSFLDTKTKIKTTIAYFRLSKRQVLKN